MENNYEPWEDPDNPWKTESAFWGYVRGGIRRSLWKNNPIKINFLRKHRERIANPNPNGRNPTVWGARCAICGKMFPLSQIEVDHKQGDHSLKNINDLETFLKSVVFVSPDDLQLLCLEDHKAKSLAEHSGVSLETAKATRVAIKIQKEKKDKEWLKEHGIIAASNAKNRRKQIISYLEQNEDT